MSEFAVQRRWFICLLWLVSTTVWAQDVHVRALFTDKAELVIDGQTHLLNVGEEKEGVKLLQANSAQCTLEINGKPQVLMLEEEESLNFTPATEKIVRINQDPGGLYRTSGTINGQAANFIVDTGASIVAMNINKAKELGLTLEKPTRVNTASGQAKAYLITLQEIAIGSIKIFNVPAVVVESSQPAEVLLGRTFLERIDLKDHDHLLELKQKY